MKLETFLKEKEHIAQKVVNWGLDITQFTETLIFIAIIRELLEQRDFALLDARAPQSKEQLNAELDEILNTNNGESK
jgi:hypothetical protein